MSIKNTNSHYGWLTITLHWLVAVLIFTLFALGVWMVDLTYYHAWYKSAPALHKSIGISLLLLMLLRLLWRLQQIQPQPLSTHRQFERKAGHTVHLLLYGLFFLIALSGYLISTADGRGIDVFQLFTVPALGAFIENQEDIAGVIHQYLAYSLILLTLLHALAALKHHIIDKDITLKRMLGWRER
ncbi:MAG: cytochrome b [Alteromonadaceae bacterium]|nr:cytochrome b [Alteromonadaceae bacterium]